MSKTTSLTTSSGLSRRSLLQAGGVVLLLGHPLEKVLNREAMANPGCLDWYVAFAQAHQGRHSGQNGL